MYADLEVPIPAFPSATVVAHYGKDFRSNINNVSDWGIGLSVFTGDVEFTFGYEDSSEHRAEAQGRVMGGIKLYF